MYNPHSLKLGIEQCKQNIEMFKGAIKKERDTIAQYKRFIKELEKKSKIPKEIIIDAQEGKNKK